MKKVLVYGISGGFGGIESFLYNVISNSDQEKVQFDILTYYDPIVYKEKYLQKGVRIFKITSKHESPKKNKREMKSFFEQHAMEYDAVWCNLAELINIDILILAKKYGIKKRIIHSHTIASARNAIITQFHYLNRLVIGKVATDFWACSNMAGNWFFSKKILKSNKFCVIRNAIEVQKYAYNEQEREKLRAELNLKGSFVVGHAGRFSVAEKNTLFLLEVFNEILNIRNDAKLVLVGDGNDRTKIEEKIDELGIRKQTMLLGYRSDVNSLLNAMDVFMLPSKAEGLGLTLIEAQASGLVCVTSDKVVPKEVAITELVEFVDLERSSTEWADKIVSLNYLNRRSRTNEVRAAGYDIEKETQRIVELL